MTHHRGANADVRQPVRVLRILFALARPDSVGLTIKDMMTMFNVSRRTVYHDLAVFKQAGIELRNVAATGEAGVWMLGDRAV